MDRLSKIVSSPTFERAIMTAILLNALTLGLETSSTIMEDYGTILFVIDRLFLLLFSIEIILKLVVFRWRFWKGSWNLFDFTIVAIAWIPAAGAFSVLRSLRILRTLRLISTVPHLRRVVSGLLGSLPGLGTVGAILGLIFYIGAVMATKLFGEAFPEWFGTIAKSLFSLFQIMTLESWSMGIVRPVMIQFPYAWMFFVPFILVTTFTTLNLLIAVLVNAMQVETEVAAEVRAQEGHEERVRLLAKIQDIQEGLIRIENEISKFR